MKRGVDCVKRARGYHSKQMGETCATYKVITGCSKRVKEGKVAALRSRNGNALDVLDQTG